MSKSVRKKIKLIVLGWPISASVVATIAVFLWFGFGVKGCDGGTCTLALLFVPIAFVAFLLVGQIHATIYFKQNGSNPYEFKELSLKLFMAVFAISLYFTTWTPFGILFGIPLMLLALSPYLLLIFVNYYFLKRKMTN